MMVKVLIVEDEMPSARKLKAFIDKVATDFEVVDILDSVSQAVAFLKQEKVDLIFLDIHLSDGNSFSIFEQVKVQTPIIFTTAFNQYALDAFQQVSVDYLLKPLEKERLIQAIQKFRDIHLNPQKSSPQINYEDLGKLILNSVQTKEYQERFMVHYRDVIRSITVDEVAAFYAENKTVYIVARDGRQYDLHITLEQLESKLNPKDFFRANRKCIVHIQSVREAVVYSKSKLKLNLDPSLPFDVIISIDKTPKFKQWLSK
ncbi:response regulator transcription factor [Labilibacter sediminis]|nr:response regulator transcription factor [Labilibacter sediminis]